MNISSLKNILITGCGGDIAISMARILRDIIHDVTLLGTDLQDDHPAKAYFDIVLPIVRADDPEYFACLENMVNEYNIDLIIPSTEPEIGILLENRLTDYLYEVPILMANKGILETGLDKLNTAEYLRSIGALSPWTVIKGCGQPLGFPCIIKPRSGCGSNNIAVVQQESISQYTDYGSDYIWQEYLYPDNEEYTCGVFRSAGGVIRTIALKRDLQGGLTGKGVVVEEDSITCLLEKLAEKSSLIGSVNAQLRLTKNGPVIFEINPRFSSTVMFRHKMGFQDLRWSIEDKINLPLSEYLPPPAGTRFYRVAHEVIFESEC